MQIFELLVSFPDLIGQAVEANQWIGYLDCDDYWFPNKLEEQIKHISLINKNN